jgi:GNAT superfamily N-acetyltransferase
MFNEYFEIQEKVDIKSTLRKEFPEVIFQLHGSYEGFGEGNDYYRLQMILVPYDLRRKGLGTKFMKKLTELSEKNKTDIFLSPDDGYQESGGMSKAQLTKMYKKLGFEKKRKDDFRSQDTMCYYAK